MALSYVTIQEVFNDSQGQPLTGSAVFTPSQDVYASGDNGLETILSASQPFVVPIVNGVFTTPVTILATDNTGLQYVGLTKFFYWTVALTLAGSSKPAWSFLLPSTPANINLFDLIS